MSSKLGSRTTLSCVRLQLVPYLPYGAIGDTTNRLGQSLPI